MSVAPSDRVALLPATSEVPSIKVPTKCNDPVASTKQRSLPPISRAMADAVVQMNKDEELENARRLPDHLQVWIGEAPAPAGGTDNDAARVRMARDARHEYRRRAMEFRP